MVAERRPMQPRPQPEPHLVPVDTIPDNVIAFARNQNAVLVEAGKKGRQVRWEDPMQHTAQSDAMKQKWADTEWARQQVAAMKRDDVRITRKEKIDSHYKNIEARFAKSRENGGVLPIVYPFLVRGISPAETAAITAVAVDRIQDSLRHLRKVGLVEKPTQEQARKAQQLAQRNNERKKRGEPIIEIEFAKKLFEAGFISRDLFYWKKLHEAHTQNGRELPGSFSEQLRYEVYYRAIATIDGQGRDIWQQYVVLGKEVDPDGFSFKTFNEEESFIRSAVNKEKAGDFFDRNYGLICKTARWMNPGNYDPEEIAQSACLRTLTYLEFPQMKTPADERNFIVNMIKKELYLRHKQARAKMREEQGSTIYLDQSEIDGESREAHVVYVARSTVGSSDSAEAVALGNLEPEEKPQSDLSRAIFEAINMTGRRESEAVRRIAAMEGCKLTYGQVQTEIRKWKGTYHGTNAQTTYIRKHSLF
jgi:hypothetical protein